MPIDKEYATLLEGLESANAALKSCPTDEVARRRATHYETLLNAWLWRYGG